MTIEKRKNADKVWVYRWRETVASDRTLRRKQIVGSKTQFPTKAAAMLAVAGLQLDVNTEAAASGLPQMTIDQFIEYYRRAELNEANAKTARTKEVYAHQLAKVISPHWGSCLLKDIKAGRGRKVAEQPARHS
ncbi:MAG: hypothetical protein BGO25_12090 [Acidobacteriales bacterium 59-55]|nr:hypothetical protein [Terriglobales bacterium]OJV43883.1 MAG: hypothetical protein BGO25_12090 [Acidobacteriales bacterium 59-55]